jgi:DNA repair photolyase
MVLHALFPKFEPATPLVGIARLAAEGSALSEGHQVEYISLENRSILTRCRSQRVPFQWMINPYRGCEFACKYCYARYTHEFMELRDGMDFERKIYAKQHTGWLLRQELRKVHPGQQIAIGTATDPYQPAERKFGVTRAILEELAQHRGLSVGLVTKSNLILRDLDVLQAISEYNRFSVHITITTLKTDLARILEPRAPRPDLRLQAVEKLAQHGIHVGINCAPVLPGITDAPADLEKLVRAAGKAGAVSVWASPLFLKPCAAQVFMPFVREKFPKLASFYEKRYSKRAFVPAAYAKRITEMVKGYRKKYGLGERADRRQKTSTARAPVEHDQLHLF